MILSKEAIKSAIVQGKLKIYPFSESQIDKAHIDLHLGDESVTLAPKDFVVAKTREKITLSEDLCGFMEGRSSLAKVGVSVEQSSTFVEPGSDSRMTLEIFNASDKEVTIKSGQPIAKMFLIKVIDTL